MKKHNKISMTIEVDDDNPAYCDEECQHWKLSTDNTVELCSLFNAKLYSCSNTNTLRCAKCLDSFPNTYGDNEKEIRYYIREICSKCSCSDCSECIVNSIIEGINK